MSPTRGSPSASSTDGAAQAKNGMRVGRGRSFAQRLAARGATTESIASTDRLEDGAVKEDVAHGDTATLPSQTPLSPSNWLTIPQTLNLTVLDSPLLFSNYQAEPSPTTGSYNLPSALRGGRGVVHMSPHSSDSSKESDVEKESSSGFGFKHLQKQGALIQPPNHGNTTNFGISHPLRPTESEPREGSRMLLPCAPMALPLSDSHLRSVLSSKRQGGISEGFPLALEDMQAGSNQIPIARDGYNWRKYGQKLVKGSESPRSYYKCTSANCPVKKKVERSPDGRVTEIVYKGEHNHGKPVPTRRGAACIHQGGSMRDSSNLLPSAYGKEKDAYTPHPSSSFQGGLTPKENGDLERDTFGSPVDPGGMSYSDDEQDSRLSPEDGEAGGFRSKRRRMESLDVENGGVQRTTREPCVVVQTVSEIDILDDGYRWRKYGQKVVKGNPHPRSYYKCTNVGCQVRKHVERAYADPKSVITTYEGKHNHDVPVSKASPHENGATNASSLLSPTTMFAPCVDSMVGHDKATSFPRKATSFGTFLKGDPRDSGMPMLNTDLTMQLGVDHVQFCMGISNNKTVKQEPFAFSTSSFINFKNIFPLTEG